MASRPRWPELRELTRHRALAFVRQPEAVFWTFAFPMILAAVLGFAFKGGGPAGSKVGVLGEAPWRAALEADELVEVVVFEGRKSWRGNGNTQEKTFQLASIY